MDGNEEMSGTFLPCGGSEVTPLPHIPGLTARKGARWLELGEEDSGSSSDLFFIIFDRLSSKLSAKGDLHPSGMVVASEFSVRAGTWASRILGKHPTSCRGISSPPEGSGGHHICLHQHRE